MIPDLLGEIKRSASSREFVQEVKVVAEGKSVLKVHMIVSEDVKIQVYYNSKTGNRNYVLLLHNQRIYGRDKYQGKWHLHPLENPEKHKNSIEVSISAFLDEVEEILVEQDLI
jgi:hypothetical protein